MSYKETFLKANIQGIIALIIVLGGMYIFAAQLATQTDRNQVGIFVAMVIGYYFGSSRSTAKKDETIANQLENKN